MKRDELLAVGMFPVLIGMSNHNEGQVCVPFSIVEPHEKQAIANHSQKLWTLASRGGLSPGELAAVLEDRPHKAMPVHEAWQVIYRAIEQRALEAAAEVPNGYVLAPKQPTQAMCIAGRREGSNWQNSGEPWSAMTWFRIYKAMLSAAPQPAKEKVEWS